VELIVIGGERVRAHAALGVRGRDEVLPPLRQGPDLDGGSVKAPGGQRCLRMLKISRAG